MNRELTQDECRDQRTLLKILERNKLAEWLGGEQYWLAVVRQLEAMQITGTTDGEDLAELTDEDARERPWVMCRNSELGDWIGPCKLVGIRKHERRFVTLRLVEITGDESLDSHVYARPLTQQEKERYGK